MSRGLFITLEGLDGSGKTTQLKHLSAWMQRRGIQPVVTRQPGGTPTGDRIRELLLDSRSTGLAPMAEMALMFADRAQAIAEIIEPALARGAVVLCDRFTDSTEAYQGGGRGLGSERVLDLHRAVCNNLQPDLTILLLPSLTTSLARARRRNQRSVQREGKDENRFERESDEFYARIHEAYETIAAREPRRVVTLGGGEGDNSIDQIELGIRAVLADRIPVLSQV
jgi:dTMP kinase